MKENTDANLASDQALRAQLREDYIRTLGAMTDRAVNVKMYEKRSIPGTFKACDPTGNNIFMTNADVPMVGTMPAVLLRCWDIISIEFKPK